MRREQLVFLTNDILWLSAKKVFESRIDIRSVIKGTSFAPGYSIWQEVLLLRRNTVVSFVVSHSLLGSNLTDCSATTTVFAVHLDYLFQSESTRSSEVDRLVGIVLPVIKADHFFSTRCNS
jgi:hypothetical protein